MNVQIVDGSGDTDGAVNGLGNLIVGYSENGVSAMWRSQLATTPDGRGETPTEDHSRCGRVRCPRICWSGWQPRPAMP
jgi:hypothetical protein